MVTGDLTYNIPLLEVPGPAGSYPLSLSYHAGIMPGEEASWVGLGWTLNPGAITRSVNGFPDDFSNVTTYDRVYWEGGQTDTYSLGVTVGINGLASVSAGLQVSHDTYRGVGVGGYVGLSLGPKFGDSMNAGVNVSVGISPYGGAYVSAGVSAGIGVAQGSNSAVSLGVGAGITTNFNSVSYSGGVGLSLSGGKQVRENRRSSSLLGASISSSGGQTSTSMTIGGGSVNVNNSKVGQISTSTSGFSFDVPILPALSLSFSHQRTRYWMDQTENVATNGVLFAPTTSNVVTNFDQKAFDSYTLPQYESTVDPNKEAGASFFNYDDYSVSAQGIAGSIKPYLAKDLIFRQNRKIKKENKEEIIQVNYSTQGHTTGKREFRFVNEFSNKNMVSGMDWQSANTPNYGTGLSGETANTGFAGRKLFGSRDVSWFTNSEILSNGATKLLNTKSTGFFRENKPANQIGGFKIISETGVTYHFSLPAYAEDEYQYSENINKPDGHTFNEFKKPEKYAYAWLLTAITGPDFVDRGGNGNSGNGILDSSDWGYWVEFNYGLWTDKFAWRNPSIGFNIDIDNNFKNYSSGKREIYFLDYMQTASHTAMFVKSMRQDAKSVGAGLYLQKNSDYGFIPGNHVSTTSETTYGPSPSCEYEPKTTTKITKNYSHTTYPVPQLKLDKIVLLENSAFRSLLPSINSVDGLKAVAGSDSFDLSANVVSSKVVTTWKCCSIIPANPTEACLCEKCEVHTTTNTSVVELINLYNSKRIFDKGDFGQISTLDSKGIRVIDLEYDYSLSPSTPNSFIHNSLYTNNPPRLESAYPKTGKLTLKKIEFKGKQGQSVMPAMSFNYDLEKPISGRSYLTKNSSGDLSLVQSNSGLVAGDILKFGSHFTMVSSISGNLHQLKNIGSSSPVTGWIDWTTTKNPPYNQDMFDMWGLYKPDVDLSRKSSNEIPRTTSIASARCADVWSLRSVKTSTGADIKFIYESDTYTQSVFQTGHALIAKNMTRISCDYPDEDGFPRDPDDVRVRSHTGHPPTIECNYNITIENNGIDLRQLYNVGQRINCVFPYSYSYTDESGFHNISSNVTSMWLTTVGADYVRATVSLPLGSNLYGGTLIYGFNKPFELPGGGYRVKSVEVHSPMDNETSMTSYQYQDGYTSYEPDVFDKVKLTRLNDEAEKTARRGMNNYNHDMLKYAREIPVPGVMYKKVSVSDKSISNGVEEASGIKSTYEFIGLHLNMIREIQNVSSGGGGNATRDYFASTKNSITLLDLTSQVGKLRSIALYDPAGTVISKTEYKYMLDNVPFNGSNFQQTEQAADAALAPYNHQGVISEASWDSRLVKQTNNQFRLFQVISKRVNYPSAQIGEVNTNFKTGTSSRSSTQAFDFYSGQPTKTLSSDGFGNYYITEIKPAYRNPAYSNGMGLAAWGGKNMLTQENETYVYKVSASNPNNKIGLVSASVKTWSNTTPVLGVSGGQPTVWRASGNYSFRGSDNLQTNTDGTYPLGGFSGFSNSDEWRLQSQITLYDVNSHALEVHDAEQVYASTKMDLNNAFVYSSATNAEYREQAYTGAEEAPVQSSFGIPVFGGGVYCIGGRSDNEAHTGTYSVHQAPGQPAIKYFVVPKEKTYRMSVWSTANQVSFKYRLDNQPAILTASTSKIGSSGGDEEWGWKLFQADLPVGSNDNLEVWCESVGQHAYFDDFRFHPLKASMTSYVYNKWGELTHVLDNNNLFTEYQYDEMGRLKATYKETLHSEYGAQGIAKVSEYKYNYGRNSPRTLVISAVKTGLTGSVSPAGNQNVPYLSSFTIRVQETCVQPKLLKVKIDGNMFIGGNGTYPLVDGTILEVSGQNYTFKNIQSPHSLVAEFSNVPPTSNGFAYCYATTDGEGNTCYTGSYGYALTNECGETGQHVIVSSISQIPSSINVSDLPLNCCSLNQPPSGGQLSLLCGCN
jgi:YD repeat-containing protein